MNPSLVFEGNFCWVLYFCFCGLRLRLVLCCPKKLLLFGTFSLILFGRWVFNLNSHIGFIGWESAVFILVHVVFGQQVGYKGFDAGVLSCSGLWRQVYFLSRNSSTWSVLYLAYVFLGYQFLFLNGSGFLTTNIGPSFSNWAAILDSAGPIFWITVVGLLYLSPALQVNGSEIFTTNFGPSFSNWTAILDFAWPIFWITITGLLYPSPALQVWLLWSSLYPSCPVQMYTVLCNWAGCSNWCSEFICATVSWIKKDVRPSHFYWACYVLAADMLWAWVCNSLSSHMGLSGDAGDLFLKAHQWVFVLWSQLSVAGWGPISLSIIYGPACWVLSLELVVVAYWKKAHLLWVEACIDFCLVYMLGPGSMVL